MTHDLAALERRLDAALERLDFLERANRELCDLKEIGELVMRYQRMCDGGWDRIGSHSDADGLAALFTEDGEYSINPERPPCRGREQ
ncbi:MAG: nuclear transport factor 2 family protein, partial [Solirubrobacteraceae bacterium]